MRRETRSVYQLTSAAAIAAVYVALTLMFLPIAYGPISFRISELLCILPYFTPAAVPGLTAPPIFCPIVADYSAGMEVAVPLRMELLGGVTPAQVAEALAGYYAGEGMVAVHPLGQLPPDGMLAAGALAGSDRMEVYPLASPDGSQMVLVSLFDNLGKGSSGAAVQCMNILLGLDETAGLE